MGTSSQVPQESPAWETRRSAEVTAFFFVRRSSSPIKMKATRGEGQHPSTATNQPTIPQFFRISNVLWPAQIASEILQSIHQDVFKKLRRIKMMLEYSLPHRTVAMVRKRWKHGTGNTTGWSLLECEDKGCVRRYLNLYWERNLQAFAGSLTVMCELVVVIL